MATGTKEEQSPLLPVAPAPATSSNAWPVNSRVRRVLVGLGFSLLVVLSAGNALLRSSTLHNRAVIADDPPLQSHALGIVQQAHANGQLRSLCSEQFLEQPLNHFEATSASYEQRFFVCDAFFNASEQPGAIFFYAGNEADVELYLNNTGLMWEHAERFNALLVFAEHRYFGKSMPPRGDRSNRTAYLEHLSSAQALQDFVRVIRHVKTSQSRASTPLEVPVIAFGGSYGGMLAAWLRMKDPAAVDGAIAASAPLLAFLGETYGPPVDPEAFLRIATFDASKAAGSAPRCVANIRRAIDAMLEKGKTRDGREELARLLHLCDPAVLATEEQVTMLLTSVMGAYVSMAMGNYPYPSSYLTAGNSPLPAYPVRVACSHLAGDFGDNASALLTAFRDSVGVFYNSSGAERCYFPDAGPSGDPVDRQNLWGYLNCAELFMPFSSDGVHDMFPAHAFDLEEADAQCIAGWGVHIRPHWAIDTYGGRRALYQTSNIVFSNGNFDPWSGTGVLHDISDSVVYVPVEGGAHHVDLFFSHPMDPPAISEARATEMTHVARWIDEFFARKTSVNE